MKNSNFLILFFVLFASFACKKETAENTNTTPTTDTRIWKDIAYGTASNSQKLDIYLPATGSGTFPVVIWIHGGAFKMGDKANPQSLTALNNAGIAVVSINYRLSGEAKWPAQLDDLKAVVKFLKNNATKYTLNPNKMASWGASAGGHLSAMMGIALADDASTRLQASVNWFGPLDFYNMDADIALSGVTRCTGANGDANSPESALIGAQVSTNKALSDAASPLSYLASLPANTVLPTFLNMHGGKDCNIGANQSVRLHTAIQTKFGQTKSTYVFLPNGTHGGGDFTLPSTETTVLEFLKKQLL